MKYKSFDQHSYLPQLDSLRFFAVFGVLVAHFWHHKKLPWLLGEMDWASLGVRLFFVLSGFLITKILLDCRQAVENQSQSPYFSLRQFYVRRFLRIFPIYYLLIFIILIVDVPPAREIWGWLATYTTNIYITLNQDWIGKFGHLWSLAVEEQFYLIWPWLVLFAPRKWLTPLMAIVILLAPLYRFFAYQYYPFDIWAMDFKAGTFTLASLDSLGMGSLLALVWNSGMPKENLQKYLTRWILPVGILLYLATLAVFHYGIKPSIFFTLSDLAVSLIFVWLVSSAGLGFQGRLGSFLLFPPFVFLGKISYGIYLYHNFMPLLISPVFEYLNIPFQVPSFENFVFSGILTVIVASLSWRFIELPINNMKRYFQYSPKTTVSAPESEVLTGS